MLSPLIALPSRAAASKPPYVEPCCTYTSKTSPLIFTAQELDEGAEIEDGVDAHADVHIFPQPDALEMTGPAYLRLHLASL